MASNVVFAVLKCMSNKNSFSDIALDLTLLIASLYALYSTTDIFVTELRQNAVSFPNIMTSYWLVMAVPILLSLSNKHVVQKKFWRILFVAGILVLIVQNISMLPIWFSLFGTSTVSDMIIASLLFASFNILTFSFIYKTYSKT